MLLKFLHVHITFCSSREGWECVYQTGNTVLLRVITHDVAPLQRGRKGGCHWPLQFSLSPQNMGNPSTIKLTLTECLLKTRNNAEEQRGVGKDLIDLQADSHKKY